MKDCNRCKITQALTEYGKDSTRKDGVSYVCKTCKKLERTQRSVWNKDKEKKARANYYQLTKAQRIKNTQEWRKDNPIQYKTVQKKYREKNVIKLKILKQKWQQENKEYLLKYAREYVKNRLQKDPQFKMKTKIRSLIGASFKNCLKGTYKKSLRTEEILGCTVQKLMIHLENKFKPGMTFKNHGQWHIDHIIPVSNAKTEEELIKLNHYLNLQPLWAEDNLKKGNKYVYKQLP
jgi:hypothetical protein